MPFLLFTHSYRILELILSGLKWQPPTANGKKKHHDRRQEPAGIFNKTSHHSGTGRALLQYLFNYESSESSRPSSVPTSSGGLFHYEYLFLGRERHPYNQPTNTVQ